VGGSRGVRVCGGRGRRGRNGREECELRGQKQGIEGLGDVGKKRRGSVRSILEEERPAVHNEAI
jgi:hypothetical protein